MLRECAKKKERKKKRSVGIQAITEYNHGAVEFPILINQKVFSSFRFISSCRFINVLVLMC